jgi:hypothetical protein
MKQRDGLEAFLNVTIGGILNLFANMIIFGVGFTFATWATVLFFAMSYGRTIAIRKIFRRLENDSR